MKVMDLADETMAQKSRNQTALVGSGILNVMIMIAYAIEVFKGTRSVGGYLIIFLLSLLPSVLSVAMYLKKNNSVAVRYIISLGFCFLYAYIMFTTTTNLTFTYIVVLVMVLNVYADIKLTFILSAAALAVNIAVIARNATMTGLTTVQVAEAEIVIVCMFLMALFSLMAVNKTFKINQATMKRINDEKEQSQALLSMILRVAEQMSLDIEEAVNETGSLKESILITKSSMEELAGGANEAVSAIQMQQANTEKISEHIGKVEQVTEDIMRDVNSAEECLKDGQLIMDHLIQQVKVSQDASNLVARYMEELREYAERMQGIMALISNVASQTGLLALNASIEAARAGEAGRGFAVVASEISNLAGQTSNATGDIDSLIGNISKSLTEVADSVGSLISSNEMQNSYVSTTAESFEKIRTSTQAIFGQAANLKTEVLTVGEANSLIISSIQNVSAVTEEVTADAGETLEGSRRNLVSIDHVTKIMSSLNSRAEELRKSRQEA